MAEFDAPCSSAWDGRDVPKNQLPSYPSRSPFLWLLLHRGAEESHAADERPPVGPWSPIKDRDPWHLHDRRSARMGFLGYIILCKYIIYIYIAENDPLLGNQRAPFSEHERSPCGVTCGFTTDYNLSFEDSAKAYILRGFIVFHQQLNLLRSHLGSFACLSFFEAARCAAARVTHSAALLLF